MGIDDHYTYVVEGKKDKYRRFIMFIAGSMPHVNIRHCGVHHRWRKRIISTKLGTKAKYKYGT